MLCLSPMPLNRRPKVPNLPDPHRVRPPAKRVRSSANHFRLPNAATQSKVVAPPERTPKRRAHSTVLGAMDHSHPRRRLAKAGREPRQQLVFVE